LKEDGKEDSRSELKSAAPGFIESSLRAFGEASTLSLLAFDAVFRVLLGIAWAGFLSGLVECPSIFTLFARRSVVFADFGIMEEDIELIDQPEIEVRRTSLGVADLSDLI
jgi:hypothetical protein